MIIGAPAFIAPEQWKNKKITEAVDQYALAAGAYVMVTGERPYSGQENPETRKRNFAKGPAPAQRVATENGRQQVPETLTEVLNKGLAIEPVDRFESVAEFARAFTEAVHAPTKRKSDKPQIFISYKRDPSAGWAVLFKRELEAKHGIAAFVDTERLDGAVVFPLRLQRGIEECDVFVCLLADARLGSEWVLKETKLAHEKNKPTIPIFQESYKHPDAGQPLEAHVASLLQHDGVHLLDRRNIHVDHTIMDLATMIKAATLC